MIKKLLKSSILLVSMVLFSICSIGCKNQKSSNSKVYVFTSDTYYPPFGFLDPDTNKYVGFDYDVLDAIAKDQNFKYRIDNIGFDAAMGAVQSNQCDAMMAAMTITEVRKEIYDFSDGYYKTGLIGLTSSTNGINAIEEVKGKVLATKIGTLGTEYAENIAKKYDAEIVYYEDTPVMFNAIIQGSATLGYEDCPQVLWAIKQGQKLKTVGDIIDPSYYGIAVKRGNNPELLDMINKGLANIRKNGTYDKLLAKWGL